MELYFVRARMKSGEVKGEAKLTDKEHLETCIKELKWDEGVDSVYVNHASMCAMGWFVNGDFIGVF